MVVGGVKRMINKSKKNLYIEIKYQKVMQNQFAFTSYQYINIQMLQMTFMLMSHRRVERGRRANRQAIFSLNRKYKQHILEAARLKMFDSCLDQPPSQSEMFTNDSRKTVIQTFQRLRYQRGDILRLIQMIEENSILKVYKAIIGLSTFKQNLINQNNEANVFRTSLLRKLMNLTIMREDPFLQLRSLEIIKYLVQSSGQQVFRFNFLTNPFPIRVFLQSLEVKDELIFLKALELLEALLKRKYVINVSTARSAFPKMEDLVKNYSHSQANFFVIKRMLTFLKYFQVNNSLEPENNPFYSLMKRILAVLGQRNEVATLNDMIEYTFTHLRTQLVLVLSPRRNDEEILLYLKAFIELPKKVKSIQEINNHRQLVLEMLDIAENPIINHIYLANLLISWVLSESKIKHSEKWSLAIYSVNLLAILLGESRLLRKNMVCRDDFFDQLDHLFRCGNRFLTAQLCSIICQMMKFPIFHQIILKKGFILSIVRYGSSYGQDTSANCLECLRDSLDKAEWMDRTAFQRIKQVVLSDRVFKLIQSALNQITVKEIEHLRTYYEGLKRNAPRVKEEDLSYFSAF